MTRNTLFEAVSYITHDLVEKASDAFESRTKKYRNILFAKRISVSAVSCACAVLLILGVLSRVFVYTFSQKYDGRFSSSEIQSILPSYNMIGPEGMAAYETVSVPHGESPELQPLPENDYAFVYKYNNYSYLTAVYEGDNFSVKECEKFADKYIPKLSSALGFETPEYSIYKTDEYNDLCQPFGEIVCGNTIMRVSQNIWANFLTLDIKGTGVIPCITLNGTEYYIDVTKSEESIQNDILAFAPVFFKIFGEKFDQIKISTAQTPNFGKDAEGYTSSATIVFYNKTNFPFETEDDVLWDDLTITIRANHPDRTYSIYVSYFNYRLPMDEIYQNLGASKIISLSEAEAWLEKGYSFGNHYWDFMDGKEIIDFSDYDYVSYEYYPKEVRGSGGNFMWTENYERPIMPYYVFYKQTFSSETHDTYAKAYIPAVPVDDMESFFVSDDTLSEAPLTQSEIDEILENADSIAFDMYGGEGSAINYTGAIICEDEFYSIDNQKDHIDESAPKNLKLTINGKEYSCEYSRTRCAYSESFVPIHIYLFDGGYVSINAITGKIESFQDFTDKQYGIFQSSYKYKTVIQAKMNFVKQYYSEMYNQELEAELENCKDRWEYTNILARINDYYDWLKVETYEDGTIVYIQVLNSVYRLDSLDSEAKRKYDAFVSDTAKNVVTEKIKEICEESLKEDAVSNFKFYIKHVSEPQVILLEDGSFGILRSFGIAYYYEEDDGTFHSMYRAMCVVLK
ncbi:MAG: hypothetical protein IKT37_00345 [Clostridia bacterium]|nr:hypothetical protein [Clostridia bacterium]